VWKIGRTALRAVSWHGIDQPRPITSFTWAAIVAAQLEEEELMKSFIIALAFGAVLPASAFAQDAPPFLKAIEPQAGVSSAWQEWMAVFNPKGALDGKTKELIGLAVAAQIPCQYCVYGHTVGAKQAGATDEQIKEAIAAAALVRKMSTELNGNQYDMAEFKKQIDAAYSVAKQ
jgi:AhpD family alkylhydroperoxidase